MFGSQWVGAAMSSLLRNECLMLLLLFPSQAVASGLIYGYVTIYSCLIILLLFYGIYGYVAALVAYDSKPSVLLVGLVLCTTGDTLCNGISD